MCTNPDVIVPDSDRLQVSRIQTGARLEKRLVKVMKALAEHKDVPFDQMSVARLSTSRSISRSEKTWIPARFSRAAVTPFPSRRDPLKDPS
ncbi:hypothetical protein EV128_101101 [Rhizobium azibense]|nr:hypothetical protein EV128_101101 [Rhizobium azibense]